METRLIEVDKAQYVKESGNFVLDATHLTENKRRRKKSGPYTRRKRGRYVGELLIALVGDIFECEVEAVYSKKVGTWFRIQRSGKAPFHWFKSKDFCESTSPE